MAKLAGDTRIVPEKDLADRCLFEAMIMLADDSEPARRDLVPLPAELRQPPGWFAEFYEPEFVAQTASRYGLPPRVIGTAPLALHRSYCVPAGVQPRAIRQTLEAERNRLAKSRSNLETLKGASRPASLQAKATETVMEDGVVALSFETDPLDDIIEAIDRFLERTESFPTQPKGMRRTVLHHIVRWLDDQVEKHNAGLSLGERESLCRDLFDFVRSHHGDRQADDLDHRYRDHLKDIAKSRAQ